FDIDCDQFLYISNVYLAKNDHSRVALHFYRMNESIYGTNGYYPSQRFPFCQFAISAGETARTVGNFDTNSTYYVEQYYYGWSGSSFVRSWKASSLKNTYFYEKQLVSEPDFVWTLVTSASEIENGGVYMIASTGSDSTNASIMRITGSGVVGITGKTVSGGRLSDSAGTSTLSGNFYMKLFKVGASGEFFVFDTQNSSYLRTTLSHDGFSSWAQLSEGGEFGGYYGAGMRCTYNFADHRLEVKTNPQNSGESAVTTIFGLANGASSPEAQGTSYLYKKTYNAHTHSYSSTVTTAATCAAAGVRTYTCSTCNHTYTETIPKDPTNHTDLCSFAAVPATCTEAGNVAYKYCSGCGNYYNGTGSAQIASSSISVAALGHDYGNWIIDTPATDSSAGRKHKTCSRCGDVQYQTLPATGVLSTTVGSVTATSGSTVSLDVALSCNPGIWAQNFVIYYPEALTLTSVTPLGDVYPAGEAVFSETLNASPASNPVMNALFEGAGISTSGLYGLAYYTDCGDVENTYSNGGILRLSFTLPTKAAGCLESYTVGIFGANTSVGDDAFDADGISLDMTYVPGVISVTDVGVCTTHSWGAVITDTAPSCTAAGSGHKVCSVCGETVSVTIPATGHTHGAWTVTIQAT
ncbi:MAG: hypothetical protein IJQ80_02570, partial [Clostridia bacterium]|nr:hypothetical protein [Clostridia bacterium]